MSARNIASKGRKNKYWPAEGSLPNIDHNKIFQQDFSSLQRQNRLPLNRNLSSFTVMPSYLAGNYLNDSCKSYNLLSESDSGTPDIRSDGSISSNNSTLELANAEATKILLEEWNKIERTLYDEDGEKVKQPHLLEECAQWKAIFPQLRIRGKSLPISSIIDLTYKNKEEEIIAYNMANEFDGEFSEGADRKTDSSDSDLTPCNSPRIGADNTTARNRQQHRKETFSDYFNTMLHISPIYPKSPANKNRKCQNNSIVKSEVSSYKWLRNKSPESCISQCDSAQMNRTFKLNYNERTMGTLGGRVLTARGVNRLQNINESSNLYGNQNDGSFTILSKRNISLPPLSTNDGKGPNAGLVRNKSVRHKKGQPRSFIQL